VIPPEWLEELEGRAVIEQVAEDMIAHSVSPLEPVGQVGAGTAKRPDDTDRYPPN
jgi:hypothetical protein